jgi:hypothetical protein
VYTPWREYRPAARWHSENADRSYYGTIRFFRSAFQIEWSTLINRPPEIIPLVYALEWVESNPSTASLEILEKEVEKVKRRILERVCARANEIARERMKTP